VLRIKGIVGSYFQDALDSVDGDTLLAKWGLGIVTGSLLLMVMVSLFPFIKRTYEEVASIAG
jgi:hypothetical protein